MVNKTLSIFRTVYYIVKHNCPFYDHSKLIELQELNKLYLGYTLNSRFSSTSIIDHAALKMEQKIVSNIIETEGKLSILIDKSTTISSLHRMVVYIHVAIYCED